MWPSKLEDLAREWGMSVDDLLEAYAIDSVAPAICMNAGCEYTSEYEPDQREGWCELCATSSVESAFVLAGLI